MATVGNVCNPTYSRGWGGGLQVQGQLGQLIQKIKKTKKIAQWQSRCLLCKVLGSISNTGKKSFHLEQQTHYKNIQNIILNENVM